MSRLSRLRWAVRAALALGVAASVAANVLHAEPSVPARVISAWAPVALLITIELVARIPSGGWLAGVRMAAAAVIAGVAAWVSYWHMAAVAARYGEGDDAAHLIPISVDGLVVVASVCLVEIGRRLRAAPYSATRRDAVPLPAAGVADPADLDPVAQLGALRIVPDSPSTELGALVLAAERAVASGAATTRDELRDHLLVGGDTATVLWRYLRRPA